MFPDAKPGQNGSGTKTIPYPQPGQYFTTVGIRL